MSTFWIVSAIGVGMMIALAILIHVIVRRIDIPEPGAD
jgi:zinc transporter ZupT